MSKEFLEDFLKGLYRDEKIFQKGVDTAFNTIEKYLEKLRRSESNGKVYTLEGLCEIIQVTKKKLNGFNGNM